MYTNDIATLTQVHPNTVRLYEQLGYISPVRRQSNGYRVYSDIHVKQMQIARLAFKYEFIQNNLRDLVKEIVQLSGQQQFEQALKSVERYLVYLHQELTYTQEATAIAQKIYEQNADLATTYTHQQVAQQLQLSEETIRNWERNGLFDVARTSQKRRQYTVLDVQKLLIIRTLRSAHFSIASIRQMFEQLQQKSQVHDLRALLSYTDFQNDFYHITDDLEKNLQLAIAAAHEIIDLLRTFQ